MAHNALQSVTSGISHGVFRYRCDALLFIPEADVSRDLQTRQAYCKDNRTAMIGLRASESNRL